LALCTVSAIAGDFGMDTLRIEGTTIV
jgi:hypothetical protein